MRGCLIDTDRLSRLLTQRRKPRLRKMETATVTMQTRVACVISQWLRPLTTCGVHHDAVHCFTVPVWTSRCRSTDRLNAASVVRVNIRFYWFDLIYCYAFSALTLLVGHLEEHPACKKTEWWSAGMVICLKRGADLHMAQLMPLPLTVSCFSKIQIDFTFLVPADPGSPRQRTVKWVCVCVCLWLDLLDSHNQRMN